MFANTVRELVTSRGDDVSTTMQLAQGAAGISDTGLVKAAAMLAGGVALAGGAVGAAQGNGTINAALLAGITRQPEARGRLFSSMILGVSFVESAYFINVAFMALFVFAFAQ
jgi:F-type H+-transporting ATPase subunit c